MAYRIHEQVTNPDDPQFLRLLARVHRSTDRPLCLCTEPPTPMYVARVADTYYLKRMPDSGSRHDPSCDSYEPPAEVSGLGELLGSAIHEEVETGVTALKLGFSLSKKKGAAAPAAAASESKSVRTDGSKLTLRATLHFLWEQAGLHAWTPAMRGKRSWAVVRRALAAAAETKTAKSAALSTLLFMPETFSLERRDEIGARRADALASIATNKKGTRKLMILIGEVKEVASARFGYKLVIKHLPDLSFMVADDLHKRLQKRFADEIELWNADESTHLMTIATFGASPSGVVSIEEMSLLLVDSHWLPIDDLYEKQLLEQLVVEERRFAKGLRYNLTSERPLASAVLVDTQPKAVALYLLPPNAEDVFRESLRELIDGSELAPWVWKAGLDLLPTLPALRGYEPCLPDLEAAVVDVPDDVDDGDSPHEAAFETNYETYEGDDD